MYKQSMEGWFTEKELNKNEEEGKTIGKHSMNTLETD